MGEPIANERKNCVSYSVTNKTIFHSDGMSSSTINKDLQLTKFTHGTIIYPETITGFPTSLPDGLRLITVAMGTGYHFAVINCKKVIRKGTRLGPFTGDHVTTDDVFEGQDNAQMWEVTVLIVIVSIGLP